MTRLGSGLARSRRWLRVRALLAGSWLACHLPEGPLVRLADLGGDLWYRTTPTRAAQARRNLRRVVTALAADGRGSEVVRAASTDPRALERLVRLAYRHAARYYLEVARLPSVQPADLERMLVVETPDTVAEAFTASRPVIFIGLHFGAIELPALLVAGRAGQAVAPMETLEDRDLQGWFIRTRGAVGIRIVGLREARRELLAALRSGTSVGLVGDRDLTGGGTLVPLFGAPARLPMGPALLAVEADAPAYVVGVRRVGVGRYRGRLERVAVPADGDRRTRVAAALASIAAGFERIIVDAPEQWWAVFFPIWPDLELDGEGEGDAERERGRASEPAAGAEAA
jgi:KDO2-lipid IV(A) lauroyltransferase